MYKTWRVKKSNPALTPVQQRKQMFALLLLDIGRFYPPSGEIDWNRSPTFSNMSCGGPWQRGQIPSCDHEACALDGDGESLPYRF